MPRRFATVSPLPRLIRVIGPLALVAVVVLTGCSSGQVTQTSRQASTVIGAAADVGDLALRDIRIIYPSDGSYAEGSTAEVAMAIINRGVVEDDRLIDVTGDFFDEASVDSAGAGSAPSVRTTIPGEERVLFGTGDSPPIELEDLSAELFPAQVVLMTFVFENAGEVTVEVPVANPTRSDRPEETFDFHADED